MADDSAQFYDVPDVPSHWSFQLLSHLGPCTGMYPAWVNPVGILETKAAVIYNQTSTRGVVRAAYIENLENYVLHDEKLNQRLSGFDFRRHYLFAYAHDDVTYHDEAGKVDFVKNVLSDARFANTDPFVRLSIAIESRNSELNLDEMRRCARYLMDRGRSNFLQEWYQNKINVFRRPEDQLGYGMPDFAAELEQSGILESLLKGR